VSDVLLFWPVEIFWKTVFCSFICNCYLARYCFYTIVESVTNLLLDFYVAEKTQVKQFFYMMIKGSSNVRSKPHICSVHLKSVLRIRIRDPGLGAF
jgi:hypothetical protein